MHTAIVLTTLIAFFVLWKMTATHHEGFVLSLTRRFFPSGNPDFFDIPADFWSNPAKYRSKAGWRIFLRAPPPGANRKQWVKAAAYSKTGRKLRFLIGRRINNY